MTKILNCYILIVIVTLLTLSTYVDFGDATSMKVKEQNKQLDTYVSTFFKEHGRNPFKDELSTAMSSKTELATLTTYLANYKPEIAVSDPFNKQLVTKSGVPIPMPYSLVKGNRNAIFLVDNDKVRHLFPDFFTFANQGFDVGQVVKISDEKLNNMDLGDTIKSIPSPPPFRPDDFMYHENCGDPRKMVDDLGVVTNMGNFHALTDTVRRANSTKSLNLLLLGGSITAGGYFMEFVRLMSEKSGINVTYANHGHGATDIIYSIYCVDIENLRPDMVFIDFSVNDYGHPKKMDALIRKVMLLESAPVIVLVNLWVFSHCPTPRYIQHSFYYNIPLINLCPAINLCYGKRLPAWMSHEYSTTDGVHPWGTKGVLFIGQVLHAWWRRYEDIISEDTSEQVYFRRRESFKTSLKELPPPMFKTDPIGDCTSCEALAGDSDQVLTPVGSYEGFRIATRIKIGFGGFNPINPHGHLEKPAENTIHDKSANVSSISSSSSSSSSKTKSFRKSWQADTPGSHISFKFYGSSVSIAMWQRRDGMGILHATVDGNERNVAKASGFFKGYSWAMEKNNTGRSEIVPLFEGLDDKEHILKLTVSHEPANTWVKGHVCQIFALLSASNDPSCRKKIAEYKVK